MKTKANKVVADFFILMENLNREAGKPLEVIYVRVFDAVARSAYGLGNVEIERNLGASKAAVSRALSELSDWSSKKDARGFKLPGYGWIRAEADPRDGRLKTWVLTEAGTKVWQKSSEGL